MGIEKRPISTRLDEKIVEKLKELADKENRTLSNVIETIIKKYIEQNEKTKN